MLLGDPRQSDQRTQSFHFSIVVHQSLDPADQSSAQAPSALSLHAPSRFERSTGSERVDALGLRTVEVIICMITRDFSVISMTSQASLSLSLPLTKVTDAQYRKRFRASYIKTLFQKVSGRAIGLQDAAQYRPGCAKFYLSLRAKNVCQFCDNHKVSLALYMSHCTGLLSRVCTLRKLHISRPAKKKKTHLNRRRTKKLKNCT